MLAANSESRLSIPSRHSLSAGPMVRRFQCVYRTDAPQPLHLRSIPYIPVSLPPQNGHGLFSSTPHPPLLSLTPVPRSNAQRVAAIFPSLRFRQEFLTAIMTNQRVPIRHPARSSSFLVHACYPLHAPIVYLHTAAELPSRQRCGRITHPTVLHGCASRSTGQHSLRR